MGLKSKAVELYKKAIKYDPNNLGFYYNLSRIDEAFFKKNNIDNIKNIVGKNRILD